MLQKYAQKKLAVYVQQYLRQHPDVKLIAVTGTTGKSATKTAIATVLSRQFRIRMNDANATDMTSLCLDILGIERPPAKPGQSYWLNVVKVAKRQLKQPADAAVIIVGMDTASVGEIAQYGKVIRPTIGVVTAVGAEQMMTFGTVDKVAEERLALANFSELALINRDDIDGKFADLLTNQAIDTYGTTNAAEYRFESSDETPRDGYSGMVFGPELPNGVAVHADVMGEHSLRTVTAAAAVALKLGLTAEMITAGIQAIHSLPGQMNKLRGMQESILIDDTAASDPLSAEAALHTLYSFDAPQRIALFGDMQGLGSESANAHQALGQLCDPNLLAWVVTVGPETEQHLAPAAKGRGCQVKSFKNTLEAGAFVHKVMEQGAVVLAKGSAENIYLEEALKMLLHETSEDRELVRQSAKWMETKNAYFASLSN